MSSGQLLTIGTNNSVTAIGPNVRLAGQVTFKKGVLYFRVKDDFLESLFFTTEDIPEDYDAFHTHNIAQLEFGETGKPFCGKGTEYMHYGQKNGAGEVVKFHQASDENLRLLFSRWDRNHDLTKWFSEIDSKEGLATEEKQRLHRIAAEFTK